MARKTTLVWTAVLVAVAVLLMLFLFLRVKAPPPESNNPSSGPSAPPEGALLGQPPPPEMELLQGMIDNLPEAQTNLQHPDPMQVDRADKVTVRVSTNMSADLSNPTAPLSQGQK